MSEPVILHWERVIQRNVRSREGMDIGNIISEAGDTFIVMQDASREYEVPKSDVEGFKGSEV
jgi:RNase P/RNase MRP subunit p29